MSLPTSLRRAAAVLTATALVSAGGLAGGALLGTAHADVYSVSPSLAVNNGTKTLTLNGTGFGLSSSTTVALKPTFTGVEVGDLTVTLADNTTTPCAATGSCTTLTGTVPLLSSAPGSYDVVVTTKGLTGNTTQTCPGCFTLQTAGQIAVTQVEPGGQGDGSLIVTGTNFANGASVAFLKPDGTVDPSLTFTPGGTPASGSTAATTAYPSPTRLLGRYTVGGGFTPGVHQLQVSNTDATTGPTVSFTQPAVTSVRPNRVGQGAANVVVTITGTGFQPLSTVSISTPDVTIAGSPVTTADGSQITVPITVSAGAATTERTLTVRGPDGAVFTVPLGSGLTVTPSPKLTSSSVTSRGQASTSSLTLTGTGFAPDAVFSFGPGVTVTTLSTTAATAASNVTTATVRVVGDQGAATGARTLVLTNPDGGTSSSAGALTISPRPQVTAVSPASGQKGKDVTVTITGSAFVARAVVTLGGPAGVSAGPATFVNSTQLITTLSTTALAASGARDLILTNPDGGTYVCADCFGVNSLGMNTSAVTDAIVSRPITFTGAGLTTATRLVLYPHGRPVYQAALTPVSTTVRNADGTLTATFSFTGVAPGPYDAEATTGTTTLTCTSCLLVSSSVQPVVSSVAPAAGGQGAPANTVVITGTGFTRGMVATFGAGTTTAGTTFTSPTQLTATIAIDPSAATGSRTVTVTAGDATSAQLTNGYAVTVRPTATAVSSSPRGQGFAGDVTVTGANFVAGATITFGAGITAVVKSVTQGTLTSPADTLVATLQIAPSAPTGARDVTITNPDGGLGTCTGCFSVSVGPGLTSVSPGSIAPDPSAAKTVDNVVLTGTAFTGTPSVVIPNVTVSKVVVAADGASLTATFSVDSAAVTGARSVTVTNLGDGGTSTCTACFYLAVASDAPATISVVTGDHSATVSWTPPTSTGGAPVTSYLVQAGVGSTVLTVGPDARSQVFTGLTNTADNANAPTTFTVLAQTVAGNGASASQDAVVGPVRVTISGPSVVHPPYNRAFYITGTAPAGASVDLHFHRAGTASTDFSIVRTVVANGAGNWVRLITPNVDYRYYASVGTNPVAVSGTVANEPAATLDGPDTRTVARNATYTLTGTSVPGSVVYLHFHQAGTAADDYSIVRSITTGADGTWTRPYLASTDYRLYVSRSADNLPVGTIYLLLAR